jgi:hypothetical protein
VAEAVDVDGPVQTANHALILTSSLLPADPLHLALILLLQDTEKRGISCDPLVDRCNIPTECSYTATSVTIDEAIIAGFQIFYRPDGESRLCLVASPSCVL